MSFKKSDPVSTPTQALLRPSGNSALHPLHTVTAEKVMAVALCPYVGLDGIPAFGLVRVGWGIPTRLFGPFESACVETLRYFFEG